jgi:hypothetical protein
MKTNKKILLLSLIIFFVALCSFVNAALWGNLEGYWGFDNITTSDYVYNNKSFDKLGNAAVFDNNGKRGGYAYCNAGAGGGWFLLNKTFGNVTGNNNISINAWMKTVQPTEGTYKDAYVVANLGTVGGWQVYIGSPNNPANAYHGGLTQVTTTGGGYAFVGSNQDLYSNTSWNMITAIVEGNGAGAGKPSVKYYVNGVSRTSLLGSASLTTDWSSSTTLYLCKAASDAASKAGYSEMSIDELAVFYKVLSTAEISELYAGALYNKSEASPVASLTLATNLTNNFNISDNPVRFWVNGTVTNTQDNDFNCTFFANTTVVSSIKNLNVTQNVQYNFSNGDGFYKFNVSCFNTNSSADSVTLGYIFLPSSSLVLSSNLTNYYNYTKVSNKFSFTTNGTVTMTQDNNFNCTFFANNTVIKSIKNLLITENIQWNYTIGSRSDYKFNISCFNTNSSSDLIRYITFLNYSNFLNGLVSYYAFDTECTANNITAKSAALNKGYAYSSVTYKSGPGSCQGVRGESDYINLTNLASEIKTGGTISMWVRHNEIGQYSGFFSCSDTTGVQRNYAMFYSNNKIDVYFGDGTNINSNVPATTYTDTASFHHHVIGWDSNGKIVADYYDGISRGTVTTNTVVMNNWNQCFIGGIMTTGTIANYLSAYVDEVAVYNRVLDVTEINTLYSSGTGIFYADFAIGSETGPTSITTETPIITPTTAYMNDTLKFYCNHTTDFDAVEYNPVLYNWTLFNNEKYNLSGQVSVSNNNGYQVVNVSNPTRLANYKISCQAFYSSFIGNVANTTRTVDAYPTTVSGLVFDSAGGQTPDYLQTLTSVSYSSSNIVEGIATNLITVYKPSGTVAFTSSLTSWTGTQLLDEIGTWSINATSTSNYGTVGSQKTTFSVGQQAIPTTIDGYYGYILNNGDVSIANIDSAITNEYNILGFEIKYSSWVSSWNNIKNAVNYSYSNKNTVSFVKITFDTANYNNPSESCTNIATISNLKDYPYSDGTVFIIINQDLDKANYTSFTNSIASCIRTATNNKFPIYSYNSISGLDNNYVSVFTIPLISFESNISFWITSEYNIAISNITKSRIYYYNDCVLAQNGYCYQETATTSTYCGGVSTGNYYYTSGWDSPGYVYDGNWSTSGGVPGDINKQFYINYTKPGNALVNSIWQVRSGSTVTNLTVTTSCWNANPTTLQFRIDRNDNDANAIWSCRNATTWEPLRTVIGTGGINEEAMWWKIVPINCSLVQNTAKNYNTNIIQNLRADFAASSAQGYAALLTNGDYVGFNPTGAAYTTTNGYKPATGEEGKDFYDFTNKILYSNISSSSSPAVTLAAESIQYVMLDTIGKVVLTTNGTGTVFTSTGNILKDMNYTQNGTDATFTIVGAYDAMTELWNPDYGFSNVFMITYEQLPYTYVTHFENYSIIIIAGGVNTPTIVNQSLRPLTTPNILNRTYGYVSVADYNNLNSSSQNETDCSKVNAWETNKINEAYNWTDLYLSNVFIDGFDIGYSITPSCFTERVRRIADAIHINKQKKVIFNTYTIYQQVANYGDYIMRESCFSRWDGVVGSPIYSYEDFGLMLQNAQYLTTNNKPVFCMAFGDADDYDKMAYDYHAFAVLYGANGQNMFRYGQPNFQVQREIRGDNFGDMLQLGWTNNSATDLSKRYENGIVHFDPTRTVPFINGKYFWFDDGKTVNSLKLKTKAQVYAATCAGGTGIRIQMVNASGYIGSYYDIDPCTDIGAAQWTAAVVTKDITAEYTDNGHYFVTYRPISRADATGTNLWQLGETDYGVHSWWDNTASNPPAPTSSWTAYERSGVSGNFQTINYYSVMFVNETTSVAIDQNFNTIYERFYGGANKTSLFYSDYSFGKTVVGLPTYYNGLFTFKNLTFLSNGVTPYTVSLANTSTCDEANPEFASTIILGKTHQACYEQNSTGTTFRIAAPHLSNMTYTLGTDSFELNYLELTPLIPKTTDDFTCKFNLSTETAPATNVSLFWYRSIDNKTTWNKTTLFSNIYNNIIFETEYVNTYYTDYPEIECFQETATVATSCGGLSTGQYGYNNDTGYLYMNYTKPSFASSTSLWQVYWSGGISEIKRINYSIPSICFNAYSDKIALYYKSLINNLSGYGEIGCFDSSMNTIQISNINISGNSNAMSWIYQSPPTSFYDEDYTSTYNNCFLNGLGTGIRKGWGTECAGTPQSYYTALNEEAMWWNYYTDYKCEITVSNPDQISIYESNQISVYPLENIVVYSPPTPYYSHHALDVNFSVKDLNEGIVCSLFVNSANITTSNVSSQSPTVFSYIPPSSEYYNYYLKCYANGEITTSDTRYFIYDTVAPTFANFTDNSTTTTPQIGDTIKMSAYVYDDALNFKIDYCYLVMNDTGVYENKSYVHVNSNTPYQLNFSYTITSNSTYERRNVQWKILCADKTGTEGTSDVQNFTVKDITVPTIAVMVEGLNYNLNNTTVLSSYFYNVTTKFNATDYSLSRFNITVDCVDDGNIYSFDNSSVSTATYYQVSKVIDISGKSLQVCSINATVYDGYGLENSLKNSFYIGGAINLSTNNQYSNTSFNAFNATIRTISSLGPGLDRNYTVTGNTQWIENVSEGTYVINFTSQYYLPQSYAVTMENVSQRLVYETLQGIVNFSVRNVKTLVSLTNFTLYVNNTNTSTYRVYNSGTDTVLSMPLDAGNYDIFIIKDGYGNGSITFTLNFKETKIIVYDLSFIANFFLIKEEDNTEFNISGPTKIEFQLHCPNSTIITIINDTTPNIPITCNYLDFTFFLTYTDATYYRSFLLSPTEASNYSIYLFDGINTPSVAVTLILDDLLDTYVNPSVWIYKYIEGNYVQISSAYLDLETKMVGYLIQNNQYIVELHSDNKPTRIMGNFVATISGTKSLRPYSFGVGAPTNSVENNLTIAQFIGNVSGVPTVLSSYNDSTKLTTNVVHRVDELVAGAYINRFSSTSTESDFSVEFNAENYTNSNLRSCFTYTRFKYLDGPTETKTTCKVVYTPNTSALTIKPFLGDGMFVSWAIVLLISFIAVAATIKTGDIVALFGLGLAGILMYFGLFKFPAWALAGLIVIAVISLLMSGRRGRGI